LIEKISDPLTHLVRNSLDHGIEPPDERIAKGKDPQGTITLSAAHQGGNIVIEVSDDGAGLNREKILAKARERGMSVSDSMSDADVWPIIFAPGFSTAAVITDVSGRGVGMDVAKKNIESISGRIDITSRPGQGSTMSIRLPLTLAILDGLSIAVGDQIYIVPLGFISESLQPKAGDIKEISGQGQVVHVRGEYLPMIALHKLFNVQPRFTNPEEGILVLLESEGKKIAMFVDELVGQHQVVIKSLETNYRKVPGVSGATIMGDGRVAMILDVGSLVKLAKL
jgi:two-component system chemotaxis sensor kinase CheA